MTDTSLYDEAANELARMIAEGKPFGEIYEAANEVTRMLDRLLAD